MTGADTVDSLFEIKTQLESVLQSAGFPLRKWSTNCWLLLASIPDDQRELSPLELSEDTSIKVLGLRWYPTRDSFSYKVSLPHHVNFTKRNILSDATRIFDPLGFLAPSIILIKILFQQLWLINLQWDDVVPDDIADMNIHAWTDSKIVLHWLSSPPRRWSTFIANRTSQILTDVPNTYRRHWHHVRSASNPADCASRGLLPLALIDFDLWWHGPKWLKHDPDVWPSSKPSNASLVSSAELEGRATKQFHVTFKDDSHFINSLLLRKSLWTKIIRIVAYIQRFVHRLRNHRSTAQSVVLQADELASSKLFVISVVQHQSFSADIAALDQQKILPKSSNLVSLSPFIDTSRILRVGGRIEQSALSYSTRHPIILPKGHRLTSLIAEHYHYSNLHAGVAQCFSCYVKNIGS